MKKIMTRIAALALTAALMLPAMSYASPVAEEQDMSLSADAAAAVTSTITPLRKAMTDTAIIFPTATYSRFLIIRLL